MSNKTFVSPCDCFTQAAAFVFWDGKHRISAGWEGAWFRWGGRGRGLGGVEPDLGVRAETGCQEPRLLAVIALVSPVLSLEKAMAPHSSILAWKIPWMEEPGGLQSMGLLRVGHDWATSLSLFTFMHWKRKWQPTPVFLPGESQGRGSLVVCRLWGRTESDTTEMT